jgi:hypothetical protein
MFLAETNARLLADGTLRFQIPGWRRTYYLLSPWRRGFTMLCVRGRQNFPAIAWSVAAVPPAGESCEPNPVVEAFLAEIPPEARSRVQPYPYGQCLLLSMLATSTEARDLARSNPNLFWLLAVAVNERRITADQIAALCRMKQAEILRVLTGTASKAQVRFLRKVRVREGTMIGGHYLLEAAGNPSIVHAVRHHTDMPVTLISMLAIFPALARTDLVPVILSEIAKCETAGPERVRRLHGSLRYLERAQDVLCARAFRDRLEELIRDEDNRRLLLSEAMLALPEDDCAEPPVFPPPPLPGTDTIVPITSLEELDAERRAQRHCVVDYARAVCAGLVYIYRVLAPQRATLAIDLTGDRPKIGEFKLARNGKPGRKARKAVEAWFAAADAARRA